MATSTMTTTRIRRRNGRAAIAARNRRIGRASGGAVPGAPELARARASAASMAARRGSSDGMAGSFVAITKRGRPALREPALEPLGALSDLDARGRNSGQLVDPGDD